MPARFALRVFSFEVPMPVPSTINDLSTTAGSNPPGGGENPFPDLDNYLRAHAAFIAALRDGKLDASTVSAFMLTVLNDADAATARTTLGAVGKTGDETVAGIKTFSSSPVAPTPAAGDNTTKVATTAFVAAAATPFASSAENAAGTVESKAVDPLGVREAFNATGSAPVYACRAWIKFNGSTGAVLGSGNASVTKNGTGNYTVTFGAAMPDTNYSVHATAARSDGGAAVAQINSGLYTTTQAAVLVVGQAGGTTAPLDSDVVCVSVFR